MHKYQEHYYYREVWLHLLEKTDLYLWLKEGSKITHSKC